MKRSGKWYRKNEAEVMESLGFRPTPNSGSGWIGKEDGENETALCQLKSTDADSIRIKKADLHTLEYNASVSHKIPVFAIQFIQGNEVWLVVKPEDLGALQTITEVSQNMFPVNGNKALFSSSLHKRPAPIFVETDETIGEPDISEWKRERPLSPLLDPDYIKKQEERFQQEERNRQEWEVENDSRKQTIVSSSDARQKFYDEINLTRKPKKGKSAL